MPAAKILAVGSTVFEPWVNPCFESYPHNCSNPGIEAYIIAYVLNSIGYKFKFFKEMSGEVLKQKVINGTYQISAMAFQQHRVIDFPQWTQAVVRDKPVFFLKREFSRKKIDLLTSNILFSCYDSTVWFCLAVSFSFCLFVPSAIPIAFQKLHISRNSFLGEFEGSKVLSTTGFFVLGILLSVFGNFLAINLSKQSKEQPVFTNLLAYAQFMDSGHCRAVVRNRSMAKPTQYRELLDPSGDTVVRGRAKLLLQRSFKNNPPILVENSQDVADAVASTSSCLIGLIPLSLKPWLQNNYCSLDVFDLEEITPVGFAYGMTNDLRFADNIRTYLQHGEIDLFYSKVVNELLHQDSQSKRCNNDSTHQNLGNPIKFGQLTQVFFLLGIVSLIASAALIVEYFFKRVYSSALQRLKRSVVGERKSWLD